jgi:DNA-binding NarL/FixJ family response regulator
MRTYRIVVADDQTFFRNAVIKQINASHGYKVIEEVTDGIALLSTPQKSRPNLIIMDTNMLGLRADHIIRELKGGNPGVQLLVVTMNEQPEALYTAIFSGADGYILKENVNKHLIEAIQQIRQGSVYLDHSMEKHLAADFKKLFKKEGQFMIDRLTPREKETLKLIAEGYSNIEIGKALKISVRTAEKHRANLLKKLKTKKTARLVKYAIQTGLVGLYDNGPVTP